MLFTPGGETQPVQARDDKLTISTTETPGIYRLKGERDGPVTRGFSVNLPASASRLERTTTQQLDTLLGADRYQLARDQEQLVRVQGRQREGREFFPFLRDPGRGHPGPGTTAGEPLLSRHGRRLSMTNWSFQPILNSYWAVAVLALGLFLALWVRPSFRQLSASRRRTLLVLRCLVVSAGHPAHAAPDTRQHAVQIADSRAAGAVRSEPQHAASQCVGREIALGSTTGHTRSRSNRCSNDLGHDLEIKVYSYDVGLRSQVWQDRKLQLPAEADGNQTDIGTSLHQAIEQELGKRLVGVILMGDGTQTAYQPAS